MKFPKLQASLLSTVFLAACGGGGGGDTAITTPAPTPTLNSTNQDIAAQEASSTAFLPLFSSAQTLTGAQTTDERVLFKIARAQLDKLPAYLTDAQSNNALVGAMQSQIMPCTSGSLTVSISDADNNNLASVGDSVTVTATNCVESGETIMGSLGLVINSLSGVYGSTSYSAGMTMTFNGLSVANSRYSTSMNGTLSLNETVAGISSRSQTFSTPSLTISAAYAGVTRSRSLTSYSATATRSPNATYGYLDSYTVSGAVTSSSLPDQTITFNTTTPVVARPNDDYPSSGVMVITGAANSQLKLTALSNTQVSQELDANGDGIYESNKTVNWNTLL
jgi:hypothetical protein